MQFSVKKNKEAQIIHQIMTRGLFFDTVKNYSLIHWITVDGLQI